MKQDKLTIGIEDKPARRSKKFLGAVGLTLSTLAIMTLAGVWALPIPSEGYTLLLAGIAAVWTGQVVTQGMVDRERARPLATP